MGQGELAISIGQCSDRGRKDANQDFHGLLLPGQPDLGLKGIVLAVADGISSSAAGAVASETTVKSFLDDYYATPASWSVKTAAQRVIMATNSWLYAQTRAGHGRDDPDKGYVTTFSALVLKARTAHVFHIGDARVCRVSGRALQQLTEDHRVSISSQEIYLGRALGVKAQVEIDYASVPIEPGDVFVLTTDGVHEHIRDKSLVALIEAAGADLDGAARAIVQAAIEAGSPDNLTVQIVRIESVPDADADDLFSRIDGLPPAPILEPPTHFEGYDILRTLHTSHRSNVYLGVDPETETFVALKVPSVGLRDDPAYLRRFLMEEWIARRIDSPHVLEAHPQTRRRSHIYTVMAYCEGRTLAQWMRDEPAPELESVRVIVEQIARGLQAFHRREMVHRDLKPENIVIDASGTARIIDFGATKVAGLIETEEPPDAETAGEEILGTLQYTAPECFLGFASTPGSDIFSLGVIAYQMLTGRLPYGAQAARARTRAAQRKLHYVSVAVARPMLPPWIDGTLRKAVHPDPMKRYAELSEFMYDLRHPNSAFTDTRATPLMERNPLLFWQMLSLVLALAFIGLFLAFILSKR